MKSFDDREKAYEKRFAHDEELKFKSFARRNKLLGQWAAEKIGLTDEEVDNYAKGVVLADLEEPGEEDVFRKIRGDFDEAGVDQSDHQIRRVMAEMMDKAVGQVENERE